MPTLESIYPDFDGDGEGTEIGTFPTWRFVSTERVPQNELPEICPWCHYPGHAGNCVVNLHKAVEALAPDCSQREIDALLAALNMTAAAKGLALVEPVEPPSGFAALLESGPVWRSRAGDEPAMVIPGILVARGFAMVGGGAKEGKTWALVDMMLSIANDRPFMDTEIAAPGPVLFISAEGSHPGTVARFDMLARGKGLDPDRAMDNIDLLFRRNIMLDDPECLAYLRSIAPKYAAIIADPLVKLWNGDEDKAKDVGPFTRNLTEIAERGPVFILSHHTVKVSETSKDRNPWLNIRGSGQWYGALDSGLYIERGKGATRTLVRFSGKDYAPVPDVTFTWPDTQAHATDSVELDWQTVDDSRRTGIQEQEIAAIKCLTASPGLSMHGLRESLPGRTSTREDAIRGLIQNGTLEARPATGRRGVAIYIREAVRVVPEIGNNAEQL